MSDLPSEKEFRKESLSVAKYMVIATAFVFALGYTLKGVAYLLQNWGFI